MIRIATLLALVLTACAAPADEPKLPVSLEAVVIPGKEFGPGLRVRLVGTAKEAAMVTEGLLVKVTQTDKKATISLAFAEVKDDKGRLVVPSADKLGVVRLQTGEVARVHVPLSQDVQQALRAAAAGEVELVIEYEVSEAWGKRFGVVSGKVRGIATVAK